MLIMKGLIAKVHANGSRITDRKASSVLRPRPRPGCMDNDVSRWESLVTGHSHLLGHSCWWPQNPGATYPVTHSRPAGSFTKISRKGSPGPTLACPSFSLYFLSCVCFPKSGSLPPRALGWLARLTHLCCVCCSTRTCQHSQYLSPALICEERSPVVS